ncbi:amino acid/amide ABC transporter ATP-binding protein 2 (HAAT family) [Jatrophihabitans sp. GAS493]|uniref:ABC transporter ATP-binding protein n=1 Tax=Jatrophihabitans sp. GAS493 TaxID=1907575 RepID=UPI000BB827C2|nr:ATP-binding cassette domain-containing protein [Jatrophihabitans sp. GAS493]SOD72133.1 amino acid/amide ABC transporter ATP-binding protein 2 (HAAT family) [Jatrophihabitans sp. GAS493]
MTALSDVSRTGGLGEHRADEVLAARDLCIGYGDLTVARDLNLQVNRGELVALMGANGAGKTTLVQTLVGLLKPVSGHVAMYGEQTSQPLHKRSRQGLSFVADDRSIIPGLTARDNLRIAAVSDTQAAADFPVLAPLLKRRAGLLSGGEQQLLTVYRALSRGAQIVVIDELSQGLAPQVVDRICGMLRQATENGTAVVVVEQTLRRALAISDRFAVLHGGSIALTGQSAEYRNHQSDIEHLYLRTAQ